MDTVGAEYNPRPVGWMENGRIRQKKVRFDHWDYTPEIWLKNNNKTWNDHNY